MPFPPVNEQMDIIRQNTAEIISETELEKKIAYSIHENKPLKIKFGADPSRPDLHIGHAVVLRKLRQFQDLGHEATLIIGDFTAMIGDPTGKNETRPSLTAAETKENSKSYFEQATKILDAKSVIIRYNSEWLGKMNFSDVIGLAAKYTVARMMERDEFEKRYTKGEPISVHEFLYPLAQAMDSVELQNDVELGGTDQKFNLLVARDIQTGYGMKFPQVCITMPILEGTDGVQKMSKSLGNYIAFTDSPKEMFGKTMSIPDRMLANYFKLATTLSHADVEKLMPDIAANPRDAKRRLAREIIKIYHSESAAAEAEAEFDKIFIKKEVPDDVQEVFFEEAALNICDVLVKTEATKSKGDARRLVEGGGVTLNGEKVSDFKFEIFFSETPQILKAGKRKFYSLKRKS
jgi:tyrosyl-tRNA synthetase